MNDELHLFRGKPYILNSWLEINQPTLGEICDFGEQTYFESVVGLTATPSDYQVPLDDQGIDFQTLDDFDLFLSIYREFTSARTKLLFGQVDISKFQIARDDNFFLIEPENGWIIDKDVYTEIVQCVCKTHNRQQNREYYGNEFTRKQMIENQRRRLKRKRKPQSFTSVLKPLISFVVNSGHSMHNYETIWDITISQLYDAVLRIEKIMNIEHIYSGIYAGTVEANKIKPETLNYLGAL